jgi:hypothetical protein
LPSPPHIPHQKAWEILAGAYTAEVVLKQDDMCLECVAEKFEDYRIQTDRSEKFAEVRFLVGGGLEENGRRGRKEEEVPVEYTIEYKRIVPKNLR